MLFRSSEAAYFARRLGCLGRMKPGEWGVYLREKAKYYWGRKRVNTLRFQRVPEGPGRTAAEVREINRYLDRLELVYEANNRALGFYRSRPYPGRVTLFNAVEQDPALIRDPHYGWVGLAREIESYVIPGNHETILFDPQVRVLAARVAGCLQ